MDLLVTLFLVFVGIYVLYISIKSVTLVCPKVVEYRYLPRTLDEEMREPVKVSEIFRTMFETQQPYPQRGGNFL
jgi:hypothetical protein